MTVRKIKSRIKTLADKKHAEVSRRFFKTGPGEYGEGDRFIGVRVPVLRKLAREFENISVDNAGYLLQSPIHEERMLALLILIRMYTRGDDTVKKQIYELYLNNTDFINNWDLVDVSAAHIVGHFLQDRSKRPLYRLTKSKHLWQRRISIVATFFFIKQDRFTDTLNIAEMLLIDQEDLIHKAVGWMLREVGKRDLEAEEAFLRNHYKNMPRTMLRYAIERFPEPKRQRYLKGLV